MPTFFDIDLSGANLEGTILSYTNMPRSSASARDGPP